MEPHHTTLLQQLARCGEALISWGGGIRSGPQSVFQFAPEVLHLLEVGALQVIRVVNPFNRHLLDFRTHCDPGPVAR